MDHTGQSTVDRAETVQLNNLLSGNQGQFLDKLCLVRLEEWGHQSIFLWPAIVYRNKRDFLEDVKENVDRSFEARFNLAPRLVDYFNQHPFQLRGCRIAFLLGMPTIEDSFIALGVGVGIVEKYEDYIDELLKNNNYKDNELFMQALNIVDRRLSEIFEDSSNEDEDNHANVVFDLAKVGFNSGNNPPLPHSLMAAFNSEA